MPRSGTRHRLVEALAARLPFHYGWVILACVCAAGVVALFAVGPKRSR